MEVGISSVSNTNTFSVCEARWFGSVSVGRWSSVLERSLKSLERVAFILCFVGRNDVCNELVLELSIVSSVAQNHENEPGVGSLRCIAFCVDAHSLHCISFLNSVLCALGASKVVLVC